MTSLRTALDYTTAAVRIRWAKAKNAPDRGALSIELAILISVLVLAGIGLGAFIATKLTEKENAIK
jgi:hypothetical protein